LQKEKEEKGSPDQRKGEQGFHQRPESKGEGKKDAIPSLKREKKKKSVGTLGRGGEPGLDTCKKI